MRRILLLVLLCSSLAIAQEIKRPTADVDDASQTGCGLTGWGTATNQASAAMTNAYDTTNPPPNGTSSNLLATTTGSPPPRVWTVRSFQTWQTGSTYASLTVNVNWSCSVVGTNSPLDSCTVAYYDGTSWTTILQTFAARARTTDSATISPTQNLSTLKIKVCSTAGSENGAATGTFSATAAVYDIWTSGVLASASSPNINVILIGDARRKER